MRWGFRVRGRRGAHPAPHSTARPRVALAVRAAQMAQAGVTRGMDNAMAGLEALLAPATPAARLSNMGETNAPFNGTDASLGSAAAWQAPATLMRETMRAARLTGRRPEDVLTEALADWLAGYSATAAAAPSPLHIPGRQHSWGEIEETLRALRAS